MIIELLLIAIIFMAIITALKRFMIIGFKLFGAGLAVFIILALLGYIL